LELRHANFRCFVVIAQAAANAETHFAQDDFKADSASIALQSRQDALDENVSLVLRVVECRRSKESENFLLFISIKSFWMRFKCANVTTQAA
jgi:hypothetical protein